MTDMTENEKIFVDTNILVYAYDKSEGKKHIICKNLVANCFSGNTSLHISNQILAEFSFVTLNKIDESLSLNEVKEIVNEINLCNSWNKVNYSTKTVEKVLSAKAIDYFWDMLIAETMRENGITTIYTENEKDFKKIPWLKVVNPIK